MSWLRSDSLQPHCAFVSPRMDQANSREKSFKPFLVWIFLGGVSVIQSRLKKQQVGKLVWKDQEWWSLLGRRLGRAALFL